MSGFDLSGFDLPGFDWPGGEASPPQPPAPRPPSPSEHPALGSTRSALPSQPVWDSVRRLLRVQVIGADRAAGREIAAELLRMGHPLGLMDLRGRRARDFEWNGERVSVHMLSGDLPRADLAFVCTAIELARQVIPVLLSRGTRVVDLSGASRLDPDVPLVVDALNGNEVGAFTELVALPVRSATILARVLDPIASLGGLLDVDVFAPVSNAEDGTDLLALEHAITEDLRRLLGHRDLPIDIVTMRSQGKRCDVFAVKVRTRRPLEPQAVAQAFAEHGLALEPDPAGPLPEACRGSGRIHVGRIRAGSRGPGSLCFFAVGDQLRAGAAQAALTVACRLPAGA